MFTQTLNLNTNKCNGCAKHCTLGAAPCTKKKGAYIPTINGKAYVYFYDQNRIKRISRKHFDKYRAIDQARTIAQYCKEYNPKTSNTIIPEPSTNICIGCSLRCKLDTIQTQQGFMPTIDNQIIYEYTNIYGELEKITHHKTPEHIITLAQRISKRCDFHKKPPKTL